MKLLPAVLLATVSLLGLAGCSSVPLDEEGDTQAVYQLREFKMVVNSTAPVAAAATQKAFKDLDLFETKVVLNTYDAELSARSREDQKVHVSIAEINSRQTMLKIRWGGLGDKVNSQTLYQHIERNLGR